MRLGYQYATKAGVSINVKDMTIPDRKTDILDEAYDEVISIVMNTTKVLSLMVKDITKLLMFGLKRMKN